jgi:hypothetical protein
MMLPNQTLDRRTVLKGLGTAIALPLLDAMLPRLAVAGLAAGAKAPLRLGAFYVPNGANMADWTPAEEGANFKLPWILEPLQPVKDDLLVLTGLTCDKARPNGDGPGDHARAMSAFLTGCQPRKTYGADIKAGISLDQYVAQHVGEATRFPSLEIGCESGRQAGNCDSGYSCAYSSTISWRSDRTPVPKEVNPRLVFERLFGNGKAGETVEARAKRERYRKSVLDLARDDAKRLQGSLGASDNRKLDEYLSAVRELEVRIARAQEEANKPVPRPDYPAPPPGVPQDFAEHLRLMGDLTVLAFQTDLTRVVTLAFANEGSNKPYPQVGAPEGHHNLSHHQRDPKKMEKIRRINRFHMEGFTAMLRKMKSIREGDRTLLDNCMLIYGSGNSDGNRHNHDDLPVLLVGQGGGTIETGRHVTYPHDTPLTNLYLSLMERLGIQANRFGDSTGKLPGLSG